jgi:hypothetical protein
LTEEGFTAVVARDLLLGKAAAEVLVDLEKRFLLDALAARRLLSGLMPEVPGAAAPVWGASSSLPPPPPGKGVASWGLEVLCCSGSDDSRSRLGRAVADWGEMSTERVGSILGTRTFLVCVLKVFLGRKMTTVSSMVVVKSTKPMYVTESMEVLVTLLAGGPNLCPPAVGSTSFSKVCASMLGGGGRFNCPSSAMVKVGMDLGLSCWAGDGSGRVSAGLTDLSLMAFSSSSSSPSSFLGWRSTALTAGSSLVPMVLVTMFSSVEGRDLLGWICSLGKTYSL